MDSPSHVRQRTVVSCQRVGLRRIIPSPSSRSASHFPASLLRSLMSALTPKTSTWSNPAAQAGVVFHVLSKEYGYSSLQA